MVGMDGFEWRLTKQCDQQKNDDQIVNPSLFVEIQKEAK